MSEAKIGRWGKSLAVRVPLAVAKAAGLTEGEQVDIEARGGDIVILRSEAKRRAREDALAAVAEIIEARKGRSLGGLSVRALIDEGRR